MEFGNSNALITHAIGLPKTTSAFVQLWTEPQWAQFNFCFLTFAAGQRFSSIVFPVSVNFEVDGQRTSKLFRFKVVFGLIRRGGSNRNRVAIILESINDPRLGGIVR